MQEDSVRIFLYSKLFMKLTIVKQLGHNYDFPKRLNDGENEKDGTLRVEAGIQHNFNKSQFFRPKHCDHCGKLLKGVINQVSYYFEPPKLSLSSGILMQKS